ALAVIAVTYANTTQASALSGGDFKPNRIIDDDRFYAKNTITPGDIQNFLNSKVPVCDTNGQQLKSYTYNGQFVTTTRAEYAERFGYPSPPYICLKDFSQDVAAKGADSYCSEGIGAGKKSAAQIIYEVGQACSINPRVLLVLLQKEQSLLTDDWPWPIQYQAATGFGCPDTAACDPSFYGFVSQVYYAARQYQIYVKEPGRFNHAYGVNSYVQYNPNSGCGGSNFTMATQATAGLYNYTPYQPNVAALNNLYGTGDGCSAYGNRNFWRMYNDWFGSSIDTGACTTTISGNNTGVQFTKARSQRSDAAFMIYTGAATNCVEFHAWNPGFGSWRSHTASNAPSIDPANSAVHFADLNGDGSSEAILVGYRATGSGMIEFHVWDSSLRRWSSHHASNAPSIDPAVSRIAFADVDGDGKDEGILIGMNASGTGSGNVEMHVWNPGFSSWKSHHASNAPGIDPAVSQVSFGDIDGDGRDEGILVGLRAHGTGSGNVEMHVWNPGFSSWKSHHASNAPAIDPTLSQISFADVDGDGRDEGTLVGLRKPVSGSGNIEFHVWNPGFSSWKSHHASNQPANP
ncbi:MAG TPA: VCBS repeat-containing protein, partial [Candidatus Limnocylindrales bacterium]|nr:VCBS repeat-containing protein [Candidatus Limnocylindrales bacterium]